MQDYLRPWQLPLMAAFVVIWLIGGMYLTRWALLKFAALPTRKVTLGKAAAANLLYQGAALVAMAIVAGALALIGKQFQTPVLYIVGSLLGVLVMLGTSYVVHWAALELPAGKLIKMVLATSGPVLVLAIVVGLAMLLPARFERLAGLTMHDCVEHLAHINDALERYARRNPGRPVAALQAFVDEGYLKPEFLVCPGSKHPDSYLYAPLALPDKTKANFQIRVTDRKGNHGSNRVVLFQDQDKGTHVEVYSEDQFQELARQPQNSHILPLVEQEK